MTTPGLAGSRRSTASGRLSADVKSALCNALKWDLIGSADFMIKVPHAQRAAITYLRSRAEPCAEYFGPQPGLQFRLSRSQFAAVWRACPNEV